jgi:hypothetical protein
MRKILSYMQIGILTVLCLATSDAIAQAAQPTAFGFKVTLLGTSTPNPLPDRLDQHSRRGRQRQIALRLRTWRYHSAVATKNPAGDSQALHYALALRPHRRHPGPMVTGFAPLPYGRRNTPLAIHGPKGTVEMMAYQRNPGNLYRSCTALLIIFQWHLR